MKTLIIDDSFAHTKIAQKLMEPYGECDIAHTGEEGIEKFQIASNDKKPYVLILLDIILPGKSGHDILKEIRKHEEEHGIYGEIDKVLIVPVANEAHGMLNAFSQKV